ncbi:MAG TPA: hypothetical protein VMU90_05150, partial [Solirubrobacteraceae bacterium]|nr:hypothetical protein [Solirubrobacteraceae bacterium]
MRKASLGLLAVVAAMTADCGSASQPAARPAQAGGSTSAQPPGSHFPRRFRAGRQADPAILAVIRGWSRTLRSGDVRGAARYFAVPSLMINGRAPDGEPYVTAIRSFDQAVTANASLPCGA